MKEKTADEIFEELGYEKHSSKSNERFDLYSPDYKHLIRIVFNLRTKRIAIHCDNDALDIQGLQTINKKCKELRLDIMKINNLKESIEYFKKINNYGTDKEPCYLQYELSEAPISLEWYKAILNKIKKYKPKRVIDIGSNINLFGYLFANEGIEYIGIDIDSDGCKPIETKNIKFVKANYYDVAEQFKNDICISCLCVGYLIPLADVKCKKLIINSSNGDEYNYRCTAKEIKKELIK